MQYYPVPQQTPFRHTDRHVPKFGEIGIWLLPLDIDLSQVSRQKSMRIAMRSSA